MCVFYEYEDGNKYRPVKPPAQVLIDRTRLVEAGMEGERVPEAAWQAFFDPTCAAIDGRYFERMFRARKMAVHYLALQEPARQRTTPSFFCVEED